MICAALRGIGPEGAVLDCLGSVPFAWGAALALASVLISLALWWRARAAKRRRWLALAPAGFALSALLLLTALERPVLRQSPQTTPGGGQLVVLVDRSASFWRSEAPARRALELSADRIDQLLSRLPLDEKALWRGTVIGFGAAASQDGAGLSLENLPGALRRYPPRSEPGSDLAAGLKAALSVLRASPGRRLLFIVSDFHTGLPAEHLLAELRASGAEVYLTAAGAEVPAAGLIAASLSPDVDLGQTAVLRGTILGGGEVTLEDDAGGARLVAEPADHLRAVRLETRFAQRGLQGVRLGFRAPAGEQARALFSLVRGPARLLVYGPAPWAEALPAGRWQVDRARPDAPLPPDPYDLVIIDSLAPGAFPASYPDQLLAAAGSTGLLLINGPLRGSVADPQLISDWNATSLSPILPVDSDPRLFVQQPPPRDVVIMVDVSGSMDSGRMASARSVIEAILNQLRPQDTVAILPFADGSRREFPRAPASQATLDAARRFVAGLSGGGGTAPETTIRDAAKLASNYCAFFFISDADFDPPQSSPRCFTTAISVSHSRFTMDISRWGEEILLGEGGDGRNVRLKYFEPEEREEYFREGVFRPLAGSDTSMTADVDVDGLAIAYARVDAKIGLLHSHPPPDPLFVTRRDSKNSGVVTGVFLGPMGEGWGRQGLTVTEAMLQSLIGWSDQDRYLLNLTDGGTGYQLTITDLGAVPAPGLLSASFLAADGSARSIPLQPDEKFGAYRGDFSISPQSGRTGLLVIQQGADIQRIPVRFPAGTSGFSNGEEGFDFGTDHQIRLALLAQTGGSDLELSEIGVAARQDISRLTPVHHYLLALAFLLLAAAVWSRELN